MKTTMVLTSLLALAGTGCSPKVSETTETTNASLQPSVTAVRASADLPESIKGFAFEQGGKCAIDTVNTDVGKGQVIRAVAKDPFYVQGWALDDEKKAVPSDVVLQLVAPENKSFFYVVLTRSGSRPDLVKAYENKAYVSAGYSQMADISVVKPGTYDVLIIQKRDNINLVCSTYRKLQVK
ncbi:MAG: hypothetical protein KGI52_01405 [Burkholderiales bacterium]|nr:hypothetical protein [Burkholderiales bacterium]